MKLNRKLGVVLLVFLSVPLTAKPDNHLNNEAVWQTLFIDDFNRFETSNWQDQRLWVNNEDQCYVPDGEHNTREVSNGTLKLRVVKLEQAIACDNVDKHGKQHPPTQYVAGRIASKNLKEFSQGKWSAKLRLNQSGEVGMFPAWWILGYRNNEPPVQAQDENICWPLVGSGEIDIFEHYGAGGANHYTARAIKNLGKCDKGDWQSLMKVIDAPLTEYNVYSVEWFKGDLIYRLNGNEVYRNQNLAKNYAEPFFAILNYAKIDAAPMQTPIWEMEVDWVKYEQLSVDN